ncbi:Cro/CI family transcriptional regulator [Erwinia papayae]|uniref:Cro/CI family transcriptional regulator n=1 Tax=Erwinia papayae TaxID=206499 RepID=A0ABV3N3B4_9GAMM
MKKESVINYFESIQAVALVLGVSHSAVSQWKDVIPEKNALRLYQLTNGKLAYDESLYRLAPTQGAKP